MFDGVRTGSQPKQSKKVVISKPMNVNEERRQYDNVMRNTTSSSMNQNLTM